MTEDLRNAIDEHRRLVQRILAGGIPEGKDFDACRAVLARFSHQLSAAAGDLQQSAASAPVGLLDVPSSTTPRPSGRSHHISKQLSGLATKAGEISGLQTDCGDEEAFAALFMLLLGALADPFFGIDETQQVVPILKALARDDIGVRELL